MREACDGGYKVLVIDSLSHAWRELTDEVDRISQNSPSRNSFSAWGKVTPKQKRLVDAILNFPGHLICTMRSKTEWVIGQNKMGKNVPEKLGLAPEQGKGIEYEFDLLVELNQRHQGTITKDRTSRFQDKTIEQPGEDFGIALYDWLAGGTAEGKPYSSWTAQAPQTTAANPNLELVGKTVIQEIGKIITAVSPDGQPYFSEAEKDEGRQLIKGANPDEKGIDELREFRDFLTNLLMERSAAYTNQPDPEASLKRAA
jgi:hypothetical protein